MEKTFTMIKPDAVEEGNTGLILADIENAGFNIIGMKILRFTKSQAESFYAVHRERPFFPELISYITRGKVVVIALEKEDAVLDFRTLIGATNPAEAADGTIRKKYAKSIAENAIHGSDSVENGAIEVAFFFSNSELLANQ